MHDLLRGNCGLVSGSFTGPKASSSRCEQLVSIQIDLVSAAGKTTRIKRTRTGVVGLLADQTPAGPFPVDQWKSNIDPEEIKLFKKMRASDPHRKAVTPPHSERVMARPIKPGSKKVARVMRGKFLWIFTRSGSLSMSGAQRSSSVFSGANSHPMCACQRPLSTPATPSPRCAEWPFARPRGS